MNVDLRFEIPDVNGEARGKVSALADDGGRLLFSDTGNYYSARVRNPFCRTVAERAHPMPARAADDTDETFRTKVADVERLRAGTAAETERHIMDYLRTRERQAEEAAAAGADDDDGADDEDEDEDEEPGGSRYFMDGTGIYQRGYDQNGEERVVRLTNFSARIVEDSRRDDGFEEEHTFTIQTEVRGRPRRLTVPARGFRSLDWATEHLGPQAIVYAGQSVRDHARVAIQELSSDPPPAERVVYTHTGWREIGGRYLYLSAGGGIGPEGVADGVEVDLTGPLARFELPAPPEGDALAAAVRASLRLFDLAAPPIVIPPLAALWRSVIGECDSSVHLHGASGVFKTELAALVQQHFGAGMDRKNLPASWMATDNALEGYCATAKDALLVIDEFHPRGTASDIQAAHRKADRVFRGIGNSSGRGRMRADGTQRVVRPPRCTVLSTGEDVPTGQSLKARVTIIPLAKGDIDPRALAACQRDAADGLYAQAMAGFVRWVAPRYVGLRARMKADLADLRERAAALGTTHARTPDAVANLAYGLHLFLQFAEQAGVVTPERSRALFTKYRAGILAAAAAQADHQQADEPAARFIQLLDAAITSGGAHLANPDGDAPDHAEAWGWRRTDIGTGGYRREDWQPRGERVGWVDEIGNVYLQPDAAFKAAQAMAANNGLSITETSLRHRLDEKKMIQRDPTGERFLVRRTLSSKRHNVMWLAPNLLASQLAGTESGVDGADGGDDAAL